MRKPFDVLAKGPDFSHIRGDKTPIELFIDGVRDFGQQVRELVAVLPRVWFIQRTRAVPATGR